LKYDADRLRRYATTFRRTAFGKYLFGPDDPELLAYRSYGDAASRLAAYWATPTQRKLLLSLDEINLYEEVQSAAEEVLVITEDPSRIRFREDYKRAYDENNAEIKDLVVKRVRGSTALAATSALHWNHSLYDAGDAQTGVVVPFVPPVVVPSGPQPTPLPDGRGGILPARGGGMPDLPEGPGLLHLAGIGDENDERFYARLDVRDGTYEGYAKDGVPDGFGTYKSVDQIVDETYVGNWRDGKRDGVGTLTQVNSLSGYLHGDYGTDQKKRDESGVVVAHVVVDHSVKASAEGTIDGTFKNGYLESGDFDVGWSLKGTDMERNLITGATEQPRRLSMVSNVKGSALRADDGMYDMDTVDTIALKFDAGHQGVVASTVSFVGKVSHSPLLELENVPTVEDVNNADHWYRGRHVRPVLRATAFTNMGKNNSPIGSTLQGRVVIDLDSRMASHWRRQDGPMTFRDVRLRSKEYNINIAENGLCTVSNVLLFYGSSTTPVSGEDISMEVMFDEIIVNLIGEPELDYLNGVTASLQKWKEWKIERLEDGSLVFHPASLPGSQAVTNHPVVQAQLDNWEKIRKEDESKLKKREDLEIYESHTHIKAIRTVESVIGTSFELIWTILEWISFVGAAAAGVERLLRGVQKAAAMGKLKAMAVRGAIEERRGYSGLNFDELLPEPPRQNQYATSSIRRRSDTKAVCMVDSVVDAFLKARVA